MRLFPIPVDLFRLENLLADKFPIIRSFLIFAEEAAVKAFMAGGAGLLDLDEQNILIAIDGDGFDGLDVPAGFAFEPELISAAAEEMGFAGLDGFFEGIAVHPGHHEDLAGIDVLNDGGNKPAGIEFELG